MPLTVFCFFGAGYTIFFLFGSQWEDSVMSFQILSVSIWLQMIASSTGAIYQSANRTDLLLFSGVQSMILNVIFIIIGVAVETIESVAALIVISFSINFIINNYLLMYRALDGSFTELFSTMSKPMVIGILQIVTFALMPTLRLGTFFSLFTKGIIFIVLLLIVLFVTGQLKEFKTIISK